MDGQSGQFSNFGKFAATWCSRVIVKVPFLEDHLRLFEKYIRKSIPTKIANIEINFLKFHSSKNRASFHQSTFYYFKEIVVNQTQTSFKNAVLVEKSCEKKNKNAI